MLDEQLDELKKLSPTERIKRLKKLTEDHESNMSKIEGMLKESEKELNTKKDDDDGPAPETTNIADILAQIMEEPGQTTFQSVIMEEELDSVMYAASQQIEYVSTRPQQEELNVDTVGQQLDKTKYQNSAEAFANQAILHKTVKYQSTTYRGLE